MHYLRRYLFSVLTLALLPVAIWGWWHSSKVWTSVDVETPFGIFRMQSESSMFGIGAQFMRHDHRWAINSSPDEITGDVMKFLPNPPSFKMGDGLLLLILPYWQLALAILLIGSLVFWFERRRVKSRKNLIEN